MLKMMRATLGENVAPEYAPLMREEMGFVPREVRWTQATFRREAGAATCADRRRRRLRHRAGRFARPARHSLYHCREERRARRHLVCQPLPRLRRRYAKPFLFVLVRRAKPWTRYFAQRQELLDYLKKVALEYDIRKHLRLNTRLTSSRWDETKRRWISTLKTANGEEIFESTTLVSAIGQLNDPSPAHFKGEEDFKGRSFTRRSGPTTSSSTASVSP